MQERLVLIWLVLGHLLGMCSEGRPEFSNCALVYPQNGCPLMWVPAAAALQSPQLEYLLETFF